MTPGELADLVLQTATGLIVDPPERRYVSHGTPAGDLCEELVVWVDSFGDAAVNSRPGRCAPLNDVWVRVQLTRCHPTVDNYGGPPPVGDLHAHGVDLTDEAWRLWQGLIDRAADWGADLPTWDRATVSEPEGGYASWTFAFTTRLV